MLQPTVSQLSLFTNAIAQGRIEVFADSSGRSLQDNVDEDIKTLVRLTSENVLEPRMRLWANDQCLVVPKRLIGRSLFAGASATLAQAGWPIVSRRSGGTTVPNGPGILNVSLFHQTSTIDPSSAYEPLTVAISEACERLGIGTVIGEVSGAICSGAYDISVQGRKIAGCSAYRRQQKRVHWLAHAVIFVACELEESLSAVSTFESVMGISGDVVKERHANLCEFF